VGNGHPGHSVQPVEVIGWVHACAAAHLLEKARQRLSGGGKASVPRGHRAVNFYQAGIEQHHPEPGRYDVIWLQWAALYLTDGACVACEQPASRVAAAAEAHGCTTAGLPPPAEAP